ncbi:MAG: PIG-L family deacetylase [Dehalococcoidia bacterium]|nr:MAG: PIG-L family deacetylase [Dehalococcoidia bacterium]
MTMAPEIDMDADFITELTAKVPRRALAIFAHPDDAEFSCGGTLALLARLGWNVDVLVTTSGNKGTKDPGVTPQFLAGEREEEQRRASAILGANEPVFLGFPDGYVAADNELRGLIVRHIRLTRPELVITWDGFRPGFNHRDHRYTGQATYDAIYPAADDHLYYPLDKEEELEPHRPVALLLSGPGEPNYHVDIEPVLRTKIRAILAHTSQMRGRTEREMLEMYRERAKQAREGGLDGPVHRESFVKILLRR